MNSAREIAEGLIQLLDKRGQTQALGEIIELLQDYYNKVNKNNVAIVRTAVSLNESERQLLKDKLKDLFGRSIQLEEHIDETIIGGMYIQVGDTVIDYTLSSNFKKIREQLEK
jgi:F-type H+-transporting ATPase subunit delta